MSASSPSRTLIFGGTFDPPHRAHVELPQLAAKELGCDRIIYIPAAINPLKADPDQPPPTPGHHRLAMLKLALRDVPNAEISTIELDREGPSYTIDTLRQLLGWAPPTEKSEGASRQAIANAQPARWHLLIGADQALDFHRWKDWRDILKLASPAVMLRPPWTMESYEAALRERYEQDEAQAWLDRTLRTLPLIDVSATEVRRRARLGLDQSDLLAPEVAQYISFHGLF